MAETKISWADFTVNIWEGCQKVSPACQNCYAEYDTPVRVLRKRGLELWGPPSRAIRYETKGWEAALRRLDRKAARDGVRFRVFINSLSDVFELFAGDVMRWIDGEQRAVACGLTELRAKALDVIADCKNLDILLLTKRPENIMGMVPPTWRPFETFGIKREWPKHVWIGTTVENQEYADERIPHLLRVPARVRFLSVEPMLGPVDLTMLRDGSWYDSEGAELYDALRGNAYYRNGEHGIGGGPAVSWILCGGESGSKARPMHPDWARALRDQCVEAGVAFHYKQNGEWAPREPGVGTFNTFAEHDRDRLVDGAGNVHCTHEAAGAGAVPMSRVGKKAAGRILDGQTWDELPPPS